ncbi:MAG: DsbA family protein [Usitatibacter sp.]
MRLLYVADPLCSWCYGFGPELSKLLASHAGTRLDLVMGGLRPFNREAMSDAFRNMLREHWRHVAQASGLPFSEATLAREGFVYDTEPACRAVVTARAMAPSMEFSFFKAVQAAFYRDAREVTRPEVLADVAAESGYGRDLFLERLQSDAMREETLKDFAAAQSMGISGFPTLAVEYGQQLYLVTSGYVTADVLEQRLAEIERRASQPR